MVAQLLEKHENKIFRFFEIVPGILTWALLLSPIWAGLLFPKLIIYYITFLTVYWFYMAIRHTIGVFIGFNRYKSEMSADWMQKVNDLDFNILPDKETLPSCLDNFKFFVLVPIYAEPEIVIKGLFDSIISQTFPLNQITLVFTIEDKYHEREILYINSVTKDYLGKFENILTFVHPQNIPGEAQGVGGANRTWGARHGIEFLLNSGQNSRNYIFLTVDGDHVLDRQFLARFAHLYLTSDKRDYRFYSTAVHLFNNNIWNVSIMSRIEANFVTLGGLSDAVITPGFLKDTFACYASSLDTLIKADFWDVVYGIDDTLFYWRAFFARDGHFIGTYHYIPYSADAVQSETMVKSHISLYKQLLRWGLGVISFPVSMRGFIKNKQVPLFTKLIWTIRHLEMKVFMISIVFLMTFGIPIITYVNPYARQTIFAYSLPDLMSGILTVALIMIIPVTYFRLNILAKPPKNWPFYKRVLSWAEGLLVIVNLLTFSFIPFVHAQTRIMLGRKTKDFYHTPKVRK